MCNYSEFLKQEAKEEQEIKDKLDFLEELETEHFSDERILKFLRINAEQLKSLREILQEKRAVVMAD